MLDSGASFLARKRIERSSEVEYKLVYSFDEGNKDMVDILGGKGANLSEMTKIGISVPFGFVITTQVCEYFLQTGRYPDAFASDLQEKLRLLEVKMVKRFGDRHNPLLVSVRSGAAVSMPGMMDTILNLGLNDETVLGLIDKTKDERFAFDSYRRFLQMFGAVVLGIDHKRFEKILGAVKVAKGVELDMELDSDDLQNIVSDYKNLIAELSGAEFPQNPYEQLKMAVEAVFKSWTNDRAITYRKIHGIDDAGGTAVTIQSMVFGNIGNDSGTGVAFTRNPSTGERKIYGEFLVNAQGEDVVAGIRTPMNIEELENVNIDLYRQLLSVKEKLELHYRDLQDIEFTIEKGKLYLLQTRSGKRTMRAALKVAIDMVGEGIITKEEAIMSIDPNQIGQMLHPQIKSGVERDILAKGLAASPGAASGKIVFDTEKAVELVKNHGEKVILVRNETSPEDISGMHIAEGILTARGGMTSHAAVVCRGMGKCCVSGCEKLDINEDKREMRVDGIVLKEGETITLDGGTGEVMLGELEMEKAKISEEFKVILEWAKEIKRMEVRANADNPEDCKQSLSLGAEGVGLCRTEHMFFDEDRIPLVRRLILAQNDAVRGEVLKQLERIQTKDFTDILEVMRNRPVVIRLLDPPLHEFLPRTRAQMNKLAQEIGCTVDEVIKVSNSLHEVNPMMGHRGCRLGVTFPEIYQMQVRAICAAANRVMAYGSWDMSDNQTDESYRRINVHIEVPLISHVNELRFIRGVIEETINGFKEINFDYTIGTMIEVPRACLTADEISEFADFFSFGTNDLTQMTFGYSRDDSGKFLPEYFEKGILKGDPMGKIDQNGVGELMKICVAKGRMSKPGLEVGICGEQAGDPESVDFCHKLGLDYISCSPFRVPTAILSAAQARIREKQNLVKLS
ncbi:pyruvate, phosphate dikinase [Candidatus Peregrinibacteria bacterium HGW-Peregrinibacteria-1]|jgi:pyruvate,orthophosphate dikinase|nr:MAG: pyruvate, phosphate dikinase [Candidatus Peregrinibacteria bacterium HGW-Peregrinibacteria-1]